MAKFREISCLSFLVTNACPLSEEFVSSAALQLIKKETTERRELSHSFKK
jgi:hypothetical protein